MLAKHLPQRHFSSDLEHLPSFFVELIVFRANSSESECCMCCEQKTTFHKHISAWEQHLLPPWMDSGGWMPIKLREDRFFCIEGSAHNSVDLVWTWFLSSFYRFEFTYHVSRITYCFTCTWRCYLWFVPLITTFFTCFGDRFNQNLHMLIERRKSPRSEKLAAELSWILMTNSTKSLTTTTSFLWVMIRISSTTMVTTDRASCPILMNSIPTSVIPSGSDLRRCECQQNIPSMWTKCSPK